MHEKRLCCVTKKIKRSVLTCCRVGIHHPFARVMGVCGTFQEGNEKLRAPFISSANQIVIALVVTIVIAGVIVGLVVVIIVIVVVGVFILIISICVVIGVIKPTNHGWIKGLRLDPPFKVAVLPPSLLRLLLLKKYLVAEDVTKATFQNFAGGLSLSSLVQIQ